MIASETLLHHMSSNYAVIRRTKRAGRWASAENQGLCSEMRGLVHAAGMVDFTDWSLRHVMAYIFLVNQSLHRARRKARWLELKRAAQKWVAEHHRGCVSLVRRGKFAGYCQARHGEWITHWPKESLSVRRDESPSGSVSTFPPMAHRSRAS